MDRDQILEVQMVSWTVGQEEEGVGISLAHHLLPLQLPHRGERCLRPPPPTSTQVPLRLMGGEEGEVEELEEALRGRRGVCGASAAMATRQGRRETKGGEEATRVAQIPQRYLRELGTEAQRGSMGRRVSEEEVPVT